MRLCVLAQAGGHGLHIFGGDGCRPTSIAALTLLAGAIVDQQ